jgi:hypothetical protein
MVARGDRPAYRVRTAQDGRWIVDALPWLPLAATSRREALDEARAAIAAWLEVPPDAFDRGGLKGRSSYRGEASAMPHGAGLPSPRISFTRWWRSTSWSTGSSRSPDRLGLTGDPT